MRAVWALMALWWVWIAAGCATREQYSPAAAPPKPPEPEPLIQAQTERLHLKWLLPGEPSRVVWEAYVPQARAQSRGTVAEGVFENVQSILYEKGKPVTDLRAGRIQASQRDWRVEASQGVYARSRVNGVQMWAQRITWFARQNRVIAEGAVKIQGKQFSLEAQRVEMDTALQQMRILAP